MFKNKILKKTKLLLNQILIMNIKMIKLKHKMKCINLNH